MPGISSASQPSAAAQSSTDRVNTSEHPENNTDASDKYRAHQRKPSEIARSSSSSSSTTITAGRAGPSMKIGKLPHRSALRKQSMASAKVVQHSGDLLKAAGSGNERRAHFQNTIESDDESESDYVVASETSDEILKVARPQASTIPVAGPPHINILGQQGVMLGPILEREAVYGYCHYEGHVFPLLPESMFHESLSEVLNTAVLYRGLRYTSVPDRLAVEKALMNRFTRLYHDQKRELEHIGWHSANLVKGIDSLTALALMVDQNYMDGRSKIDSLSEVYIDHEVLLRQLAFFMSTTANIMTPSMNERVEDLCRHIYCRSALQFRKVDASSFILDDLAKHWESRTDRNKRCYEDVLYTLAKIARFIQSNIAATTDGPVTPDVQDHMRSAYSELEFWSSTMLKQWLRMNSIVIGENMDVHHTAVIGQVLDPNVSTRQCQLRFSYLKIYEAACYFHIWRRLRACKITATFQPNTVLLVSKGEHLTQQALHELAIMVSTISGDRIDIDFARWAEAGPITARSVCHDLLGMLATDLGNRAIIHTDPARYDMHRHIHAVLRDAFHAEAS